ncbi:virulence factor MviN [Streptomyces piniterrae]|uniref:Virulence factor MviN n=1 Tax=Streptomyces piniterrae TaxID=2571125 RepID=A0A4U0NNH2_9ACTN|nr:lipid II flippase MurJ [Streptomyces piniterrae]TJZ55946.1 virulence factor MviN [Streptomyces piniterrae]
MTEAASPPRAAEATSPLPAALPGGPSPLGRPLARAAAVTAALTAAGSLCGLLRDQTLAHLFGAGSETDAFLVAWTVPEVAATLLIEDAMALLLIPAFSVALSVRAAGPREAGDPVRALLAATLPRLCALLAGAAALLAAGAPLVVRLLAPGLADPGPAVDCTRLTALTVLTFGLAGYFSAALRAHRSFVAPAAIYVAYNLCIVGTMLALHSAWGVRAAAAGVALGGAAMVLVQLPYALGQLPRPRRRRLRLRRRTRRAAGTRVALGLGLLAPVVCFTASRQAQVLIERFLASSLPAGAISRLNYAQKVAQLPMVLSLMVCTVTFPVVARALADGEADRARRRVERDLTLAGLVVLPGAAYVIACAPQIVEVLFQRGAFTAADTAATASVMRVYALGLLGHSLVGALIRPFSAAARTTWYPAAAMAAGLAITLLAGVYAVRWWGVPGIAAANAAGITATALLMLRGLGSRVVAIEVRRVATGLGRLTLAAAAAAATGGPLAALAAPPLLVAAAGALLVPAVFAATALTLRTPEVRQLLTAVKGKLADAR